MANIAAANGNPSVDALKANATAAYNSVTNSVTSAANGVTPQIQHAYENAYDQSAATSAEMSNLAAARHPPNYTAANGQQLTNYHSFFSELLSWRNPRASGIAYGSLVSLIFLFRYLDVLRWTFKLAYLTLGVTVAAEVAGKVLLSNGFATQLRPRKYYTVPRETLDKLIGDVHELINFFVIESQRIFFAENVYASAAVAFAAFLSYYLVKVVPYWGLAVIGTTVVFFAPLVYTSNQELIDNQLKQAGNLVNSQTAQLRSAAQKHTEQATHLTQQYLGDYTAKAQSLIHGARPQGEQPKPKTSRQTAGLKTTDFPSAPTENFKFEPKIDVPPVSLPELAKTQTAETEPLIPVL